jgi:hypothetical protein
MAQFDEQLDSWLDQVAEVPLVNNMSEADQQKVILIDSLVLQVSIEGYGKQPSEWTTEMFADLFFNRFVRLLEDHEKQQQLFELIPTAMMVLLDVAQPLRQAELTSWIKSNHDQLVHLYDPAADQFYSQLTKAMKSANVNANNKEEVAAFTKQYLRKHPAQSREFFTKDAGHEK